MAAIETGMMMIGHDEHVVAPPTPVDGNVETPHLAPSTSPDFAAETSPDFAAQFTNDSDDKQDTAMYDTSMDDFQDFRNPLEDMSMELVDMAGMGDENVNANEQWDLHNLMGEQTSNGNGMNAKVEMGIDNDTDVAPTMADAVAESTEPPSDPIAKTESAIQDVAASAEGSMSVPDVGPVTQNASDIPTQEANDMPFGEAPAAEEPVSIATGYTSPSAQGGPVTDQHQSAFEASPFGSPSD
jgi:hypothetical protein